MYNVISTFNNLIPEPMCFHYSMSQVARNLENRYNAPVEKGHDFQPVHHANGFGFPVMPVVTAHNGPMIRFYRWGLVPSWTTDLTAAAKIRAMTLNARSETAFEKPSFRDAMAYRRCLVPADGFFEWQTVGNERIPWFIRMKEQELFSFGGIWEKWSHPEAGSWFTFSILTVDANPMMAEIHNSKKRMPLILPRGAEARWLNPALEEDAVRNMMVACPETELEAWTISRLITARGAASNSAEVKKPFSYNTAGPYPEFQ